MIKVTVKPRTDPVLVKRLQGQAHAAVERSAVFAGEQMVREVERIVASEFNQGDPATRKPGVHLSESFTYKIERHGDTTEAVLTIKSGVNAKKIAALEYGAANDYVISPSGFIAGFGGLSQKASSPGLRKAAAAGANIRGTQWLRFEGRDGETFARSVIHKAFPGKHMMRRAREATIRRLHDR